MIMADIGQRFLQGVQIGQQIGGNLVAARNQRTLKKEMEALFGAFNDYTRFDDEAALPDAAAPVAATQALPIGEAAPAVNAAAASMNAQVQGGDPAIQLEKATRKLRTQASYEDLQNIHGRIAKIAAMSGDPKVLTALQDTFAGQVRNRALAHLADAQTAYGNGDIDGAEKALISMGKLFPSTSGLKFKRDKDGQLVTKDPLTGKERVVDPEYMGWAYKMLSSPEVVYDLIGSKREAGRKADLDERGAKVSESNAATNAQNAATQAAQVAETARSNRANEPSEIAARQANTLQALAYSDYLNRDKGEGAGGIDPNKARQFAMDVRQVVSDTLFPSTQVQDLTGAWVKAPGTPLRGYENATQEDLNRISSFAEQIGIANPSTGLSVSGQAAIEIDRVLRGDRSSGRGLQVLSDGTIQLTSKAGPPITFRATPQLQQMIMSAVQSSRQQQAPMGQGAQFWVPRQDQGVPVPMRPR